MTRLALALALLGAATASTAAPETYVVDGNHTFPSFEVTHLGMSTQRGRFNRISGTITIDREAKTGSADITIDINSIATGVEKLSEHLRKDDFFDAAKYPTGTFKASQFQFEGEKLVAITGDLTLRGVTKPATLNVTAFKCGTHPMLYKSMCGADATTTIRRSEFGIKYGIPALGDDVKLSISVEAFRE